MCNMGEWFDINSIIFELFDINGTITVKMWDIILGVVVMLLITFITRYCIDQEEGECYWFSEGLSCGSSGTSKRKHMCEVIIDLYKKYPHYRYVGVRLSIFESPILLLRDIDLIKEISIKEFDTFHDHRYFEANVVDPILSKSLITLRGEKWKQMRSTLSPVFTSSTMENMYVLMAKCAENFCSQFDGKENAAVEMNKLFGKFAADVIASTAFGIQLDHAKDPDNEFYGMVKKMFQHEDTLQTIKFQMCPRLPRVLKSRVFPSDLPEDVSAFFRSVIKGNIDERTREKVIRPDMIHLLMEARKGILTHDHKDEKHESFATAEESEIGKTSTEMELTDDHIVAQALLFFFTGYETVANATSLMAYELATHPDIQKKLHEEIDAVRQKCDRQVPYEALVSMKYLDQVLCETLRLWPPVLQTDRQCQQDFVIEPINTKEKRWKIGKNRMVVIPIIALHRDPKYFPDPDRFDPERFSDENKLKIVPGSYLPFGIGPRNCIGSRFALLEVKTLFFHLLSQFDILPTEKTEIPMKLSPKRRNLSPEDGFQLALKRRV